MNTAGEAIWLSQLADTMPFRHRSLPDTLSQAYKKTPTNAKTILQHIPLKSLIMTNIIFATFFAFLFGANIGASLQTPLDSQHTSNIDVKEIPNIIDKNTALQLLRTLQIQPKRDPGGYDRDEFGSGWATTGGLNTRELVLIRDGTNTQLEWLGARGRVLRGVWICPYTHTLFNNVDPETYIDIDHVVPLKEAWITGAAAWPYVYRVAFANDESHLISVSGPENRRKGDLAPPYYLPQYWTCEYVRVWIKQKSDYHLSIDQAEYTSLLGVLNQC